jgi:hypothetical protein
MDGAGISGAVPIVSLYTAVRSRFGGKYYRGSPALARKSRQWSRHVTSNSHALDLEEGVFTLDDPREIALSLKRSALRSSRRRVDPFRSAMSMLNFYINRAGRKLPLSRRKVLERARNELRDVFGRPAKSSRVSR